MFLGADVSYINEVEDSGGAYYDGRHSVDPFALLAAHGANLARARLWHTPDWTAYSTLDDVKRTFRRAKNAGMASMLDFHYSDTWADPAKQVVPAAWAHLSDTASLAEAVYDYTVDVLLELDLLDLMPDFVQVGNEINTELMMPGQYDGAPINWPRNVQLLNAGIRAVREAGRRADQMPRVMLHIAQPENLMPWFEAAYAAGIADFDDIGLSYYPKWSACSLSQMAQMIAAVHERWKKPIMIVETAYPWTLDAGAVTDHLLGADAVIPAYPPSPNGQRQFLIDLAQAVADAKGTGVLYWEPAWISAPRKPSIWENAALFDYGGNVHKGIEFLSRTYTACEQG